MIQPQNKTNNPDTVFISCNFTANTGTIVDVRLNKVLPEKYVEACLLVLVKLFLRQKRAFSLSLQNVEKFSYYLYELMFAD